MMIIRRFLCLCVALFLANGVLSQEASEYGNDGVWIQLGEYFDGMSASQLVEGLEKGLKAVELKKGYKSPIGQAERQKIINSVNKRHGYIWVPRKLSTVLGRLEEMLRYAKAGFQAFDIGKIIGIAIAAKNMDDAIEMLVEEGVYQGNACGEAAYWVSTIAVGLFHGKSLTEAIADGYDERYIGKWSKAGYKVGEWLANVVNSAPWKVAERDAMDKAFRDALIREGINEEGLSVVDAWLALDRETRVKMPIRVDPSWFTQKDGGGNGQVCKPGEDPFDSNPDGSGDGNGQMCPMPGNSGGGSSGGVRVPKPSPNTRVRRGGGGDTKARIWP